MSAASQPGRDNPKQMFRQLLQELKLCSNGQDPNMSFIFKILELGKKKPLFSELAETELGVFLPTPYPIKSTPLLEYAIAQKQVQKALTEESGNTIFHLLASRGLLSKVLSIFFDQAVTIIKRERLGAEESKILGKEDKSQLSKAQNYILSCLAKENSKGLNPLQIAALCNDWEAVHSVKTVSTFPKNFTLREVRSLPSGISLSQSLFQAASWQLKFKIQDIKCERDGQEDLAATLEVRKYELINDPDLRDSLKNFLRIFNEIWPDQIDLLPGHSKIHRLVKVFKYWDNDCWKLPENVLKHFVGYTESTKWCLSDFAEEYVLKEIAILYIIGGYNKEFSPTDVFPELQGTFGDKLYTKINNYVIHNSLEDAQNPEAASPSKAKHMKEHPDADKENAFNGVVKQLFPTPAAHLPLSNDKDTKALQLADAGLKKYLENPRGLEALKPIFEYLRWNESDGKEKIPDHFVFIATAVRRADFFKDKFIKAVLSEGTTYDDFVRLYVQKLPLEKLRQNNVKHTATVLDMALLSGDPIWSAHLLDRYISERLLRQGDLSIFNNAVKLYDDNLTKKRAPQKVVKHLMERFGTDWDPVIRAALKYAQYEPLLEYQQATGLAKAIDTVRSESNPNKKYSDFVGQYSILGDGLRHLKNILAGLKPHKVDGNIIPVPQEKAKIFSDKLIKLINCLKLLINWEKIYYGLDVLDKVSDIPEGDITDAMATKATELKGYLDDKLQQKVKPNYHVVTTTFMSIMKIRKKYFPQDETIKSEYLSFEMDIVDQYLKFFPKHPTLLMLKSQQSSWQGPDDNSMMTASDVSTFSDYRGNIETPKDGDSIMMGLSDEEDEYYE